MATDDRVARLEAEIDKLRRQQAELRKRLAEAQLDQWQGRIEDLEVQMHLGAMEGNDNLRSLMDQLRDRWADSRRQFEESIKTASSVAETVRNGLQSAYGDLRKALLESRSKLA
jgi:regulator of replication initiation timing